MKKCPYCAEEIQDDAIKCKHCGEMLDKASKEKWYFKTSTLIIAFLCLGPLTPLMLPLVWLNPSYNTKKKLIITAAIAVLSYLMWLALTASLKSIYKYYQPIIEGF